MHSHLSRSSACPSSSRVVKILFVGSMFISYLQEKKKIVREEKENKKKKKKKRKRKK
jgi:hypothetical protein